MKRYAIVGFGCAGYSAARAIRQTDPAGEIHVFEGTNDPPANPMLTTYYASDRLSYQGAFPFGTLKEITTRLNLRLHSGVTVQGVKAEERGLLLADGSTETFDKILVSTGARAFLPRLQGLPDPRVFLMRTMADAQALKDYLDRQPVKKAVVVGASMAGIKVAELLHCREVDVTLADFASYLFPLAALEEVGRELERRVALQGVHFLWDAAAEEITPKGIRFGDGTELEADLICLCIGTRANVELVANTDVVEGQPIRVGRGIVVNARMETSAAGIYAAGDCCEGIDLQTGETKIIGLWANAGKQGDTAGRNMAGGRAEYPGNIVHNITHFMDIDFIGLGDNRAEGDSLIYGTPQGDLYVHAVAKDKALRCINIIGSCEISGILKSYFMKRLSAGPAARLAKRQEAMLLHGGLDQEFIDLIGGVWA